MAKAKKTKKEQDAKTVEKKPVPKIMIIMILLASSVILLPTYILLFVGMLPTLSVIFTKKEKDTNHKIYCIGGLNLTGLLPYLLDMYKISNTTDYALSVISNISNLGVVYGLAIIGFGIYSFLPSTLIMFFKISASSRTVTIKKKQAKIVNAWGDKVTRM